MKRLLSLLLLASTAFAAPAELKVGPQLNSDGSPIISRGSREGAQITADYAGKYYESAARSQVFSISTAAAGTTQVAANQTPLAAGTGQPIVGVYNPLGSGVNVEIISVTINQISGTPTAGGFVYNVAYNQTLTGTTTAMQSTVGLKQSASKGIVNAATTGSTLALLLRPVPGCTSFASALAATTLGMSCFDFIDGTIVVPPGGLFALATTGGVGTTWVINAAITLREAPISTP